MQSIESVYTIVRDNLAEGKALALWRQPEQKQTYHAICSHKEIEWVGDVSIENLTTGFLLAPFDKEHKRTFIEGDSIIIPKCNNQKSYIEQAKSNSTTSEFDNIPFHINPVKPVSMSKHNDKLSYTTLVQKCIEYIAKSKIEKIVPARQKTIQPIQNFNPLVLFEKLCTHIPSAYVSLISTPKMGTWVGASPELLMSVNKSYFHTVSLAGTYPHMPNIKSASIPWGIKEREEQDYVSQHIIDCFAKQKITQFQIQGPQTWRAGNVHHLKSNFIVDLTSFSNPSFASTMLNLLHPTPAVCGTPVHEAATFLAQHEEFDRQMYSGFLGNIHVGGCTDIYVNIRCMQWSGQKTIMYAGAGITSRSNPEKEWEETEIKMEIMLNLIRE